MKCVNIVPKMSKSSNSSKHRSATGYSKSPNLNLSAHRLCDNVLICSIVRCKRHSGAVLVMKVTFWCCLICPGGFWRAQISCHGSSGDGLWQSKSSTGYGSKHAPRLRWPPSLPPCQRLRLWIPSLLSNATYLLKCRWAFSFRPYRARSKVWNLLLRISGSDSFSCCSSNNTSLQLYRACRICWISMMSMGNLCN